MSGKKDMEVLVNRASARLLANPVFVERLAKKIVSELGNDLETALPDSAIPSVSDRRYMGKRQNLKYITGQKLDLCDTFQTLQQLVDSEKAATVIEQGDYFYMSLEVPAATVNGLEFEKLKIDHTEVVVSHVREDKIVFQFEDVLFRNAVNSKNSNEGGFPASALAAYLNNQFLNDLKQMRNHLAVSNNGLKITLPTLYEVFGDEEAADGKIVNWFDKPFQLDFFKKRKNRIRTFENNTNWYWLSTAAYSAGFCDVDSDGGAAYSYADNANGGVAPAFCVAKRHE
jgi:hypothetical protein